MTPQLAPETIDEIAGALASVATGDDRKARRALTAVTEDSALAQALTGHLDAPADVYNAAGAFAAFIDGGGNVHLYDRLGAAMADSYAELRRTGAIVDIGAGDGRVLTTALRRQHHHGWHVDAVEPAEALAATCRSNLVALEADGLIARSEVWLETAAAFIAHVDPATHWDLAQSTFALHALPPADRSALLAQLRHHVGRLVIAEFDVPELPHGTPAHFRHLVERYERGLREYNDARDLVARGFLVPVLLGQIDPERQRHTWEQPASAWEEQLRSSGFRAVTIRPLCDYWWAPAVLITAEP